MFINIDKVGLLARLKQLEYMLKEDENWLSKNFHLGKHVRRDCRDIIDKRKSQIEEIKISLKDHD